MTLQSETKTNQKRTRVMRHKCSWATCQNFVYLMTCLFNRHPINFVTVYLAFQPSSQLSLSPFTLIFQPSTYEHRSVSLYLFDRHPSWPPFANNDGPKGVKGATEEDKNEAQRARPDGPDGSISMGRRKGKPISCIGPLRIKHYRK